MIFTPAPTSASAALLRRVGGDGEDADDDVPLADELVERRRAALTVTPPIARPTFAGIAVEARPRS